MVSNKLRPPTPTRPGWVAFAVVLPILFFALSASPIWMSAYGAMKLLKVLRANKRPRSAKPAPYSQGGIVGRADGPRQPLLRA